MKIVLGSKSPRRKELLSQYIKDFEIFSPDIDESFAYRFAPRDAVKVISLRKAEEVHKHFEKDDIIICADTIVTIDDEIIGKPKDKEDAKRILALLSDRTHEVITSYVIYKHGIIINKLVESKVTFNKLTEELINAYVESGSPLDKAGAYGIQDNNLYPIIKGYEGSYSNIVGLPIEELMEDLNKLLKK